MAKRQKNRTASQASAAMRRAAWEDRLADERDGRRQRAATFTDRKRESSRKACRGRVRYD